MLLKIPISQKTVLNFLEFLELLIKGLYCWKLTDWTDRWTSLTDKKHQSTLLIIEFQLSILIIGKLFTIAFEWICYNKKSRIIKHLYKNLIVIVRCLNKMNMFNVVINSFRLFKNKMIMCLQCKETSKKINDIYLWLHCLIINIVNRRFLTAYQFEYFVLV